MIPGPAGDLGLNPAKPKLSQIEFVDKSIDHPNRIILIDPVFQAFGKQRVLPAICSFNEAPHPTLPQIARDLIARIVKNNLNVFTQPGSFATERSGAPAD